MDKKTLKKDKKNKKIVKEVTKEQQRAFLRYQKTLRNEGIIKSLVCAFILGFAISVFTAFVALFTNNFNVSKLAVLWVALIAGILLGVAVTPIFYLTFFKPDTEGIAKRVDRLGLEERLVTMIELQDDESYIAMRQREDAKKKLRAVRNRKFKMSIFIAPVIVLALVFACSAVMITVSASRYDGKLDWESRERPNDEKIPLPDPDYVYYFVEYIAAAGGYIDGEAFQVVTAGQNTTKVKAVALPNYGFHSWLFEQDVEKGKKSERIEINVQENMDDIAYFVGLGDGSGESENGEEEDQTLPPIDEGDSEERFDPNVFWDGEKYLGDEELPDFIAQALAKILAGENIPEAQKRFLETYFKMIKSIKAPEKTPEEEPKE